MRLNRGWRTATAVWVLVPLLAGPTLAATIPVNSTSDTVANDGLCTLREAINAANNDAASGAMGGECPAGSGTDTVSVPAGTYTLAIAGNDDLGASGDLDVRSAMTIDGAGIGLTVLNAAALDRAFDVDPALAGIMVTISDVSIVNGNVTTDGGGIRNQGTLSLSAVSVANCTSSGDGGGIYNSGTLVLTSCTISGNNDGLAPTDQGGGIFTSGSLTLQTTSIVGNSSGSEGGGVCIDASGATVNISDSSFIGNGADTGGGLAQLGDNNSVTLLRSTFNGNSVTSDGGGIYAEGNGTTLALRNCTVSGNFADASGGGLYADNSITISINNATIAGNGADFDNDSDGDGGGIYNEATVNLANTLLANNTDDGDAPECFGTLSSQDYNLIENTAGCTISGTTGNNITGSDPALGALQNNGGSSQTHLPGGASVAINTGNPALPSSQPACETTDQRGVSRPQQSRCDIGAVEVQPTPTATPTNSPLPTATPSATSAASNTPTATLGGPTDTPGVPTVTTPTATPTNTLPPTATAVPTLNPNVCFAVPDSLDALVTINAGTGAETVIGATGAPGTIFGLAAAPVGDTLYAATADQLGTINRATGAFSAIGSFGTAYGALGPVPLDNVIDLSADPTNGNFYGIQSMSLPTDTCYAIADANDRLVRIDKTSGSESATVVSSTSGGVQAAAFVGSTLYAAIADQLGTIARTSGVFTPRFSTFGTTSSPTAITINDVRGLAYDSVNNVMYGAARVSGDDDVLFQVDLTTGGFLPFAFNGGSDDYVEIAGICDVDTDIEDLAYDPFNEVLYGSNGTDLVEIDVVTGDCDDIGDFGNGGPAITITGLSFDANGNLYGTNLTNFYQIDTATGEATVASPALIGGTDYRALACSSPLPSLLFRVDPATGSYVPLGFDFGLSDYAVIDQTGDCSTGIEAVAVDAENDVMLGADSPFQELVTVDREIGFCDDSLGSLGTSDIFDMSFTQSGTLLGSGVSTLYSIDPITGLATSFAPLTAGTDYQALECPRSGCNVVLRKRHSGIPYQNSNITYRLFWLNPCAGYTFENVTITDTLPSGLQIVSASSPDASVSIVGNTVTFVDDFLPKSPGNSATIVAKVTGAPGTQLTNQVRLRDNYGREYVAQDKIRVREPKSAVAIDLHGQSKSQTGKSITYTARFRNLIGANQLTITLPPQLELVSVAPQPASSANNVLIWDNLSGPSGAVRIRTRVGASVITDTVLTATAVLVNGGSSSQDSHQTSIRPRPTPTPTPSAAPFTPTPTGSALLNLSVARRVLPGTQTQISAQYQGLTAAATITITVPPELSVLQTVPMATVEGGQVTWSGLTSESGTVKLKALLAAGLAPGTRLPVTATISAGGATGIDSAEIEVRQE